MPPVKARIDVFISSTSIDLPEHRQAVITALNGLKLTPLGMELWPKTGENPVEKCRKQVNESEIFIGIYAHRYGWRPDGPGTPSITEMEYDWAAEVKRDGKPIPRLCFIMHDDYEWHTAQIEFDAKADLDRFKARVKADEVGFFSTPEDLALQVTQALVPFVQRMNQVALMPYLRWLHQESKSSGLLRILNPRDAATESKSVTVDKVYTPLRVIQNLPIEITRSALDNLSIPDTPSLRFLAMVAASKFERLVILGDPGSGKSTFLQFITLSLTGHLLNPKSGWIGMLKKQGWTQGKRIPVVVTLRDFAQDIPRGATNGTARLLFEHLERQFARLRLDGCFPAIQDALENGWSLVLLDGLDEVPDDRRGLVREAVTAFIQREHPGNRYIVTCRLLSYTQNAWKLPDMTDATIMPFERKQIDHFIGAWYTALRELGALDEQTAATRTEQLIAEMDNDQIARIAENPMLLTVMAIVHNHGEGRLPREIAVLYDECVKLLMQKWRKHEASRLMDTLDLREIDLYRILYQIAFKAHNEQEGRAGAADIPETVVQDTVMMALDCDQEQAKTFCDYVEEQAGLLIGRGQARSRWRVFSFPHRTFQEFLAGCYAANNEFSEQVPELIEKGEKWRVALLLATGHLVFNAGNNPEVVNAIDNLLEAHAEQPDWQKVWLAGDMLALIGEQRARTTRRGEKVIKATIDSLVNLIEGSHLTSVERAAAGRTLSVLGDPRPGVRLRGDGLPEIIWADEISAGTYWIGADDQVDNPRRQIIIAQPFRVAKYLVTQAQYLAFQNDMGKRGYACTDWWAGLAADDDDKQPAEPYFSYANHPMENVNWYQAVAFSRWLTWHYQQAGLITPYEEIRLPCEHEWEVAARGIEECTYGYPGDFDTMKCNVRDTGIGQTSAVGLLPNGESPCRALDMTGNVWEWCLNQYADGSTDIMGTFVRVLRGGSFLSARSYVHTAFRYLSSHPLNRIDYDGFRLVHLVV